jgi:phosphopantetheine--protein transferase-like protein
MIQVLGCGIDLEELSRFKKNIPSLTNNTGFAQLVYTPAEITCNLNFRPEFTFPLGFSCKEAFFKAVGVSWTNSKISWKDIELLFLNKNNLRDYSIQLSGFAEEWCRNNKCNKIESDIEFTNVYVIFQVILLSNV